MTVVIVSHSVRFLAGFADNLTFMGKTELIEMNSTKELLENPKDQRTSEFLRLSELNQKSGMWEMDLVDLVDKCKKRPPPSLLTLNS